MKSIAEILRGPQSDGPEDGKFKSGANPDVLVLPFDRSAKPSAAKVPRAQSSEPVKVSLISLHGLIRANSPELGCDADTGGQIKYVLELARELAKHPDVSEVELLTRQVIDSKVSDDYAQLIEPICEKANIVRIPFGPKRYLRKESLWPYIEMFVDQALVHFRKSGLPGVIHGHYADAGLAGAMLAQLLHVPFVFTGHSLGRIKKQRLLDAKGLTVSPESLERKYRFRERIEAEEIALETASLVVTSTYQEVEEQYQVYEHYQPARMEVIPPGVDLEQFSPATGSEARSDIAADLSRFLQDASKPMILTVARPDERKNLEQLVHVYGQCEELQAKANLVLILGNRDDYCELPKAQERILGNVLHLIDRYDLYGKVAYPKSHKPSDIPELYRLAAQGRGVFINPALTEPFGLTLLEAGATGLPIVATNDGGPNDIVANCQNGVLVDPLDNEAIRQGLLRGLCDSAQWNEWSENGIKGTREHYSWKTHADRYLRDLMELIDDRSQVSGGVNRRARRLPDFDRMIITDLDNTLTGDPGSLERFVDLLNANPQVGFGVSTGRNLESAKALIESLGLPRPDLIESGAGTQIHYGENLTPDGSWQKSIGFSWQPDAIRSCLEDYPDLVLQPASSQSDYKISYMYVGEKPFSVTELKRHLRRSGMRAKVVMSMGTFVDIIPVRGGSDMTLRHMIWKWGFAPERVLVVGDSGNDAGMLKGRSLGVVVGNHSPELRRLRGLPRIHFVSGRHAAGVLEGIEFYNFLDEILIPNDHLDSAFDSDQRNHQESQSNLQPAAAAS